MSSVTPRQALTRGHLIVTLVRLVTVVGLLTLAAGCAGSPTKSSNPTKPISFDFLNHGPVARALIIDTLGPPYATFEDGRVLAYRVSKKDAGYVPAPLTDRWAGTDFDLILVFDAAGQLQQHNLVDIHPPSH